MAGRRGGRWDGGPRDADDLGDTMAAQFDSITFWLHAFIPMASVQGLGSCFSGDDRGFSADYAETRYRIRSEITISGFLGGNPETTEFHQAGVSHTVDCATAEILETATADTDGMFFHDFKVGNTFPDPEGGVIDNPNDLTATVLYDCAATNPLAFPSPDVDINLVLVVDPVGRTLSVRGAVQAFPDYELYATVDGGAPVTVFQHPHTLDPAFALPGSADQPVTTTVAV